MMVTRSMLSARYMKRNEPPVKSPDQRNQRATGHGGHAVSRAEWDMGGDWEETFAWCEDCNVTAYPPA